MIVTLGYRKISDGIVCMFYIFVLVKQVTDSAHSVMHWQQFT